MNVENFHFSCVQREITRKLTFPKQPTNPFLEMVKFLLERIAPVHIDSEAIRSGKKHPDFFHKTTLMVIVNVMKNGQHILILILVKEGKNVLGLKKILLYTNISYT